MKRIVILGGGESGVGAAVLAQKEGFDVFLSDMSKIKDHYREMLEEHHIALATVGIYSRNTTNDEVAEMRSAITRCAMDHEGVLQMHGFYADSAAKPSPLHTKRKSVSELVATI
jgi:3-hydroxyacyl-CoA dehydrogenase